MFKRKELESENKLLRATVNNLNRIIEQYEQNYQQVVEENQRLKETNHQPKTFGGK
jgi:hypothetical protein